MVLLGFMADIPRKSSLGIGLTPHWPTLRLPCPTHRAPKRTLPGKADFHAVFISGSPKLPCPRPQGYLSRLQGTTMSIDIKHLRLQPFLPIWHPTCIRNREVRRRRELNAGHSGQALRQCWPAQLNRWPSLQLGGRNQILLGAPGVPGTSNKIKIKWSPQLPDLLEEDL
jgi:hypothetical protein